MRYFFHLESDANIHLDHRGRDFSDFPGVEAHAAALARGLADDEMWAGWSVRVIDAQNREVLCVRIEDTALSLSE